jgi:hypothetical protein
VGTRPIRCRTCRICDIYVAVTPQAKPGASRNHQCCRNAARYPPAGRTPTLQAEQAREHVWSGKAKSVICLYLLVGAPWQDMYDLKPKASADVRGEFNPIATNAPGIDICEHLPQHANWMDRSAIVCSINHRAGCHNCSPSRTLQMRSP